MKTNHNTNRPRLKLVPFESLKAGDRILCSYGTVTVAAVTFTAWRATVQIVGQSPISWHRDNWPLLVTPAEGGVA